VELYSPLKFSFVFVGILLGPCRKCAVKEQEVRAGALLCLLTAVGTGMEP